MALFVRFRKPALIGVLVVLNCFALRNFILLASEMVHGNLPAGQLYPQPIYAPIRLPSNPVTQERQAEGRLGTDFAQVYFPAQDISHLQDAYGHTNTLDPLSRPSRYAPMLILVCAATLCRLDYGYACILHMLLQILSLYGLLYWAFGLLGLKRYRLVCLLFINLSLFLTPVGLSWFERGQFSLYVASSYILLILALIKRWPMLVVAAALLAFIKWTSFPAIFVILAVYLLNSRSFAELRDNSLMVALFGVVTVGLVLFPLLLAGGTGGFLKGLMAQELQDSPQGLSLLLYAPRIIVKMLPMVLIILGYVNIRILQGGFEYLIPYILGVTTMMLIYPTRAYDYSVPTLLGFIPLILFWKNLQGAERHVFRDTLAYSFFIFLVLASFSTLITHSTLIMVVIYVIFSLALLVSPSVLAGRNFVDRRLPVDAR